MSYSIQCMINKSAYIKLKKQMGAGPDDFMISGPVSFHIYSLPTINKKIYLFGDEHYEAKNECSYGLNQCDKHPNCYTIKSFITSIINQNVKNNLKNLIKKYIDIFVEYGYKNISQSDNFPEEFIRDLNLSEDQNKYLHELLYGNALSPFSPLGTFIDMNRKCFLFHTECAIYTRFHRSDYRRHLSFYDYYMKLSNINRILTVYDYAIKLGSPVRSIANIKIKTYIAKSNINVNNNLYGIINRLNDKLGIKDMQSVDVTKYKKSDMIGDISWGESVSQVLNGAFQDFIDDEAPKISKQIHSKISGIPSDAFDVFQQKQVTKLYDHFIDAIIAIQDINKIDFDKMVDDEYIIDMIQRMKKSIHKINIFLLDFIVIIMDLYTLGRIFRSFKDGTQPENIIIFAGDEHIDTYVSFIEDIFHVKPFFSQRNFGTTNDKTVQCITVRGHTIKSIIDFDI